MNTFQIIEENIKNALTVTALINLNKKIKTYELEGLLTIAQAKVLKAQSKDRKKQIMYLSTSTSV